MKKNGASAPSAGHTLRLLLGCPMVDHGQSGPGAPSPSIESAQDVAIEQLISVSRARDYG
jgi:hypothetical protein